MEVIKPLPISLVDQVQDVIPVDLQLNLVGMPLQDLERLTSLPS